MVNRIKPRLVRELWQRELPVPLDVINLITPANFERYRWYGLLVMPVMSAVGGRVLWMGRFERTLAGEPQAEKLLVVRYPSHRRFLTMTLNPYYLAINLLREAGVQRFEASFTHASHSDPGLRREKQLVAVHFRSPGGEDALGPITELMAEDGHGLIYATKAVASLGILDPPEPTDPNPLSFGELALFSVGEGPIDEPSLAARIGELAEDFSLQLYARDPRSSYRPALPRIPRLART